MQAVGLRTAWWNGRRRDQLLAILFALFIFAPAALHIAGLDQSSAELELRKIHKLPRFPASPADWRAFVGQLEAYLTDHVGLRPALISVALKMKFALRLPASEAGLIGKDGWIYNAGDQELDQHTGVRLLSQDELVRWVDALESYKKWLGTRGIKFVFAIVPDKETIYPEHLPDGISLYETSPAGQLMAVLKQRGDIDAVDLHTTMLAAKVERLVYFKTDSHWNAIGAYLGLKAVMDRRWPGGIQLPPLSNYIEVSTTILGDLGPEIGFGCCAPERDFNLIPRAGSSVVAQGDTIRHSSASGWIDSNHIGYPTVFVFGDSFATFWTEVIPDVTRRFVYRRNDVAFPAAEILSERPDLVIYEIAEKFLTQRIPQSIADQP